MSYEGKRPVTLENLLRLKRVERPAPEFWAQFDRELRAKQLAALVEKRPWWREMPRVFGAWRRYHRPMGAAAVLALTFVTVRNFSTTPNELPDSQATERHAAFARPSHMAASETQPASLASNEPSVSARDSEITEGIIVADQTAKASNIEDSSPAGESRFIPLLVGTLDASPATAETSPSARYIAANLAAIKAVEAAAAGGLLGGARTFDTRALVTRTVAIEPLQQMTPPSEARLARYRSPFFAMAAEDAADRTGERVARRISGERLYEQISRISGRGDRLNVKF